MRIDIKQLCICMLLAYQSMPHLGLPDPMSGGVAASGMASGGAPLSVPSLVPPMLQYNYFCGIDFYLFLEDHWMNYCAANAWYEL